MTSPTRIKVSDLLTKTGRKDYISLSLRSFPQLDDLRDPGCPITCEINLHSLPDGIIVTLCNVRTEFILTSDLSGKQYRFPVHVSSYEIKFLGNINDALNEINDTVFPLDTIHGTIDIADPLEHCLRLCLPVQCLAPGEVIEEDDN
ncbi:MAG: hypothetical protein NZL83_01575 [Candidatus Absconditabacterales bacterium]|nr:hypothetical protein [Candidatus Absconditabacterales bacterium]